MKVTDSLGGTGQLFGYTKIFFLTDILTSNVAHE